MNEISEIQIIPMAQVLNFIKSGHNPVHIIFSWLSVIYQFYRAVAGIFLSPAAGKRTSAGNHYIMYVLEYRLWPDSH